jgi:hypothetical protein
MGVIKFWSDMTKRAAGSLLATDKLMVGKQDQSDPQYTDLDEVKKWLAMNNLRKDGYRWHKGEGNSDLDEYEVGDEISGVGTLWPGYKIEGYINTAPMTDKNQHITITQSNPI